MKRFRSPVLTFWMCFILLPFGAVPCTAAESLEEKVYAVGHLKPVDSRSTLKVGRKAPDFTLPSISGERVSLKQYAGKKNVVISFVPAAYTPVCSAQWPRYDQMKTFFDENDTVVLGITVDNIPTLNAWVKDMEGLWFPVLSDFWPHGAVAGKYGILRSSGTSERAIFLVDKKGIIRFMDIHDINEMPGMEVLIGEVEKLKP